MNLLCPPNELVSLGELLKLNPLCERKVEPLSDHQLRVGELASGVLSSTEYGSDEELLQLIRDCGAAHDVGKTHLNETDGALVWGSEVFDDDTKKHITHIHQELGASHTVDALHKLSLSEPAKLRALIIGFVQGNHHYIAPDPNRNLFSGLNPEARGQAEDLTVGISEETLAEATELARNINGVVHICDRIEALTSPHRSYRDPITLEEAVKEVIKAVEEEIGEGVTFFGLAVDQIAEYAAATLEEINRRDKNQAVV